MPTPHAAQSRWKVRDMAYIAVMAGIMAICAWISIPALVPFTLQTFGLFTALGVLGGRRGTFAVLVYLLLGAVGLPVFAGFTGGLGVLLGTLGGYLLGFLLAAVLYWAMTGAFGEKPVVMALAMVLGMVTYYIFGTAWFLLVYARTEGPVGLATALGWCVVPFVLPDLAKIALALAVTRLIKPHIR